MYGNKRLLCQIIQLTDSPYQIAKLVNKETGLGSKDI